MKPKPIHCYSKGPVRVISTTKGLKRCPPSKYPCVLFLLKPQVGTRVQVLPDGTVEFMARFGDLRAFLHAIDPKIAALLPANLCDKPAWKEAWFYAWNQQRRQTQVRKKP